MEKRKYTYTELGMLFGIFIGGGAGTVLFASTGNVLYLTIGGVGVATGLVLGAGLDRTRRANSDD